jgi:hypothetical protein
MHSGDSACSLLLHCCFTLLKTIQGECNTNPAAPAAPACRCCCCGTQRQPNKPRACSFLLRWHPQCASGACAKAQFCVRKLACLHHVYRTHTLTGARALVPQLGLRVGRNPACCQTDRQTNQASDALRAPRPAFSSRRMKVLSCINHHGAAAVLSSAS